MNSNLEQLVREMNPQLNDGQWAFCTLPDGTTPPAGALAVFRETEATTVIVPAADAASLGLERRYVAAWITLTVFSDLDAVGFLAVISRVLAAEGISCNVMSAVHHDHLFVPYDEGRRAVDVLRQLQSSPLRGSDIQ
jgi:uncharacterized protein